MKISVIHKCKALLLGAFLLVGFSLTPLQAQRSEIGLFGGGGFYLGELNPTHLFAATQPAGGLIYRYNLTPRWALKADFIFGRVAGSDAVTNKGYERNLSFYAPITEFSVEAELNFFNLYNSTGKNRFTPYIFAGVTLFSFNPKTEYNGTIYELQSFGTEGQGLEGGPAKNYSLTSFAIPFGIGLRATIGRYFSIGAEWGIRYTFTDYLDDVRGVYYDNDLLRENRGDLIANLADRSPELTDDQGQALPYHQAGEQRGNTTTTDIYSFFGLTFTVRFGNEDKTCDLRVPRKRR